MTAIRYSYLVLIITAIGFANPRSAPPGNAGAPGDTNPPCSSCHRVTMNPSGGKVELTFPGGQVWRPGEKQAWLVKITEPDSSRRFGFQLTTRPAGQLTAPASSNTAVNSGYIYHTASQSSYSVEWTPPANTTGDITIYVAALTGRGTSNSNVYTNSYVLKAADSATAPQLDFSKPAVNGASFIAPIAPAAWTTIYGQNLAPAGISRSWREADFQNGAMPTALDGVSVRINNKSAAIAYISPTQLNVLSPDDTALGSVTVEVTTPAGVSAPATVTLTALAPAFFCFDPQDRRYAAALSATYETLGPANLFAGAITPRPAKPGEIILLYGTGFGSDTTSLRVAIGGVEAKVTYAGLTTPGLHQLNVEVPDLSAGDHAVTATIGGVSTQPNVYLAITR